MIRDMNHGMNSCSVGEITDNEIAEKRTIIDIFKTNVYKYSSRIAVSQENIYYTYSELDQLSDIVAANLASRGIGNNDIVGIYMDRNPLFVVVILGVLKCNGIYMPLSKNYPIKRIEVTIETANAKAVVVQQDTDRDIFEGVDVYLIEELKEENRDLVTNVQEDKFHENQTTYILFTSGTTGKPKGIEIYQKSIINLARSLASYILNDEGCKVIGVLSEFVFDVSEGQFFLALLYGHTLDIVPDEVKVIPSYLFASLKKKKYDCMEITPTMLQMQLDYLELQNEEHFPEYLVSCGEALPLELCKRYFLYNQDKNAVVLNCYGPTETCVYSSVNKIDAVMAHEMTYMHLGKPIQNTVLYVMDEDGLMCSIGQKGELYIGGIGVAKCYVNMRELTEEKFVQNPYKSHERLYKTGDIVKMNQNGDIEFFGRKDDQVKIRGNRIELREIEDVMMKLPGISLAKAQVKQEFNRNVLVLYYIDKKTYDFDTIVCHMEKYLPNYMIPNYFVPVNSFKLNFNGKLDISNVVDYRTCSLKQNLVEISEDLDAFAVEFLTYCKKLMRKEDIFLSDSLRFIGGDSLTILYLMIFVRERWDVDISFTKIASSLDLADIVSYIRMSFIGKKVIRTGNVTINELPVSSIQKIILENDSEQYGDVLEKNLVYLVKPNFTIDEERFHNALTHVVNKSDMLQTTFHKKDGRFIMKCEQGCRDYYKFVQSDKKINSIDYTTMLSSIAYDALPLFNIYLFQDVEKQQRILLNFSHLIFDYYSLHILLSDVFKYYRDEVFSGSKGISIFEYLGKQQNTEQKEVKEFWKEKLYKHSEVVCFPSNKDVKRLLIKKSDQYDTLKFVFDGELLFQIREICKKYNVMEPLLLKSGMIFLLYKLQKKKDIIIGMNLAGRNSPEESCSIGLFTKLIPCRYVISEESILWENIVRFQNEFYKTIQNGTLNIDEIYQSMDIADMVKGELFQIIMNYSSRNVINLEGNQLLELKELSHNLVQVPIYINCASYEDKLVFEWTYVERFYTQFKLKEIIEDYTKIIRYLCMKDSVKTISILNDKEWFETNY